MSAIELKVSRGEGWDCVGPPCGHFLQGPNVNLEGQLFSMRGLGSLLFVALVRPVCGLSLCSTHFLAQYCLPWWSLIKPLSLLFLTPFRPWCLCCVYNLCRLQAPALRCRFFHSAFLSVYFIPLILLFELFTRRAVLDGAGGSVQSTSLSSDAERTSRPPLAVYLSFVVLPIFLLL